MRLATAVPLLGTALAFSVAQGPTPLGINFWSERWGRQWHLSQYLPDRQAAVDEASGMVPGDPAVMVVTQNDLNSAALAHRHFFYAFPVGADQADYVFLDTRRMPFLYWAGKDRRLYDQTVAAVRADPAYQTIFDRDGILLLRRVARHRVGPPDLGRALVLPPEMPGSAGQSGRR
jgi:hypothetical protein